MYDADVSRMLLLAAGEVPGLGESLASASSPLGKALEGAIGDEKVLFTWSRRRNLCSLFHR